MRHALKLFTMLALLTASISLSAQPGWGWQSRQRVRKHMNKAEYSVRVGWGGGPFAYADRFECGRLIGGDYYDIIFNPTIAHAYMDMNGSVFSTGTFTGDFNWNAGRFWNLSATMALCPVWSERVDGVTLKKEGYDFGMAISLMPNVKLMYCNTKTVRVYSSIGLGLGFYPGFKECTTVCGEIQFNPVGVEVGRKWYGFGEIGIGTLYAGGRIGVGYQFGNIRRNHR